jgi:HptB-dependent secretion and biofilm anti anti-sigma factor
MALETQIIENIGRIIMKGRFDFHIHKDFKAAYIRLFSEAAVQQIEIDMSKLEYLDSSALGMLMLLNERAKLVNKSITLVNPSGVVNQVLEVANFNRLFDITRNT